jgi:FMN reductase
MSPLHVVGLGGSMRTGSSTELVVRGVLAAAAQLGASTTLFTGHELVLPPYEPGAGRSRASQRLVDTLRGADAVVIGSPGYHGSISGLVKNALDYTEEMREDPRPYFDGVPVACVATGFGWQGAVHTLGALRDIVHALRGWPTPLGLAVNTKEPGLFGPDRIESAAILKQVHVMATQLVTFASGRA